MPEYVSPEIPQDPATIRSQMVDDLETGLPGLEVKTSSITFALLSVFAFLWAQLAEQSSQVFSTVFRYFGQNIVRLPLTAALPATTTVTFTAINDDGPYMIPAGTEINLLAADGTSAFRTTADATILNGSTTVTPVTVVAATPGAAGNGLSTLVSVTQRFSWLDSVTVLAPSAGGAEGETADQYQNKLTDLLTLPVRTLARPANFETYARNFPGIDRALSINDAPGRIKVYVTELGLVVSSPVKAALLADFQALALLNLIPEVDDPTYTVVNVAVTGVVRAGNDPDIIGAIVEQAILDFLNPATWALPQEGDVRGWEDRRIVRYQDVSQVVNEVEGFDYHTALTINGVAADFTLTGPAALPDPTSTAVATLAAP